MNRFICFSTRFSRVWRGGLALAALCFATPASANGRFPESNHFFFSDKDPDLVMERTTFGLLVSHDRGKTFQWVCEPAMGLTGSEDTMLAVTPSGAIVGTTFQGLTRTQDQGCAWGLLPGDTAGQVFIDMAQNPNDSADVVAFSSTYKAQSDAGKPTFTSQLWESKDEGKTFARLGLPLDPNVLTYTVDLTKTDPNRIYVSAVRNAGAAPTGSLFTSPDHGATWIETPVPLQGTERSVWIAAVDPANAGRVYLRTSNAVTSAPDRLIVADLGADADAGAATLRTVYTATGSLRGFALSADGSRIYIGGPKDGVKTASTSDFAWQGRANIQVQCLALTGEGLWACSNEQSGFIAGISHDDGVTFQPLIHFCDIQGPLTCNADSPTAQSCDSIWPGQREALGCLGDGGPGGSGSDGGDGGSSDNAAPLSSSGSKCTAEAPGSGSLPWSALVPGALVVAGALARRRRR